MKRLRFFYWAAALMLALALAPPAASAQEDGTVTISGVFNMDYQFGENNVYNIAPELLAVYVNGHEHTWTLTLYGTTQSHSGWVDFENGDYANITEIQATSFDLEFFGPDAAMLNGFVSDHLAGGSVDISLQNTNGFEDWGFALMKVAVNGNDGMYFETGHVINWDNTTGVDPFPIDANGYPVIQSEPFSIETHYTVLGYFEPFAGNAGIGSLGGLVTFAGNLGDQPPPLPTLSIQDGSVLEGRRGTTDLDLTVTLSKSSTNTVTVRYATDDGTANAGSDYNSAIGTLTFQPGQTSKTISISVKGDRKREPNETFFVDLFDPVGATIADGSATATILNDD